jgi:tRNA threonylcarbamoyladenosine biosynthesis protein TsaE
MKFEKQSLNDLPALGKRLLEEFDRPVVAFYGKMGSGKTTLIKVLCSLLDVQDTVSSPTFSLVNEYVTKENDIVYHFDFYRIKDVEEIYDFGYEEYFFSGRTCFIEWPELVEDLLPEKMNRVFIDENEDGTRNVKLEKEFALS